MSLRPLLLCAAIALAACTPQPPRAAGEGGNELAFGADPPPPSFLIITPAPPTPEPTPSPSPTPLIETAAPTAETSPSGSPDPAASPSGTPSPTSPIANAPEPPISDPFRIVLDPEIAPIGPGEPVGGWRRSFTIENSGSGAVVANGALLLPDSGPVAPEGLVRLVRLIAPADGALATSTVAGQAVVLITSASAGVSGSMLYEGWVLTLGASDERLVRSLLTAIVVAA